MMMPPCVFLQGMDFVAAGTVSAGMDGTEMRAKSGLAQSILNNYMGQDWSLYFSRPLEQYTCKGNLV